MKYYPFLTSTLFAIGLAYMIILAIPGIKGIGLALLVLVISVFASKRKSGAFKWNHAPLLFVFAMIAAFTSSFFCHDIPARIYPAFICWLLCMVSEFVFWLLDKRYEGLTIKQLLCQEFRFPPIVDFLIVLYNLKSLLDCERNDNGFWLYLIVILAAIDLIRQIIWAKRGKMHLIDLF